MKYDALQAHVHHIKSWSAYFCTVATTTWNVTKVYAVPNIHWFNNEARPLTTAGFFVRSDLQSWMNLNKLNKGMEKPWSNHEPEAGAVLCHTPDNSKVKTLKSMNQSVKRMINLIIAGRSGRTDRRHPASKKNSSRWRTGSVFVKTTLRLMQSLTTTSL